MRFWGVFSQGTLAIYIFISLAIVIVLVARTSRRVLGIQVSLFRAFLVVVAIAALVGPATVYVTDDAQLTDSVAANTVTLIMTMLCLVIGVFTIGLLALMVLEVLIPTGSMPPLGVLLRGWPARFKRARRYLAIMSILFRRGLTAPMRGVLKTGQTTAESIRLAMQDAGVTFVKLGQLLSSRNDLLPPEFIKELSKLTSDVTPRPYRYAEETLIEELGDQLSRLEIDPQPLASASLAQVYSATLDGHQQVVVKVQRQGAGEQAEIDLQILSRLSKKLVRNTQWARRLGIEDIVQEFSESMRAELDFTTEVANMDSLRPALVAGGVQVPKAYHDLCNRQVIVMDRLDASPISRAGSVLAEMDQKTRDDAAEVLLKAVLGQLLNQGIFHADLHAGNVVIWPDGKIGLLDYGSVGRLDANARCNLGLLLWAVDADDPALATDAVLELLDHDGRLDEHDLQRQLGSIITQVRAGATGSTMAFFTQLMRLVLDKGMRIPGNIALAMRCLAALEGTLKLLNPHFNIVASGREQARSVVGDITPRGVKEQISNQAIRLVPLVSHLPRRLNRISDDLANGRFTSHIRMVSHHEDQEFLTSLANQVVVAILAGFAVIGSILLVTASGGPQIRGVSLFDILGFFLGSSGVILALRSVAMVFGRRN